MIGIIEQILRDRYGGPVVTPMAIGAECRWNLQNEPWLCALYKATDMLGLTTMAPRPLQSLYGDAVGGFLLLGSLKITTIGRTEIYGLYTLEELAMQPDVFLARHIDSSIEFFMDSCNVWFYGMKEGDMYVYDSGTGELDRLGPANETMMTLLEEWEES